MSEMNTVWMIVSISRFFKFGKFVRKGEDSLSFEQTDCWGAAAHRRTDTQIASGGTPRYRTN